MNAVVRVKPVDFALDEVPRDEAGGRDSGFCLPLLVWLSDERWGLVSAKVGVAISPDEGQSVISGLTYGTFSTTWGVSLPVLEPWGRVPGTARSGCLEAALWTDVGLESCGRDSGVSSGVTDVAVRYAQHWRWRPCLDLRPMGARRRSKSWWRERQERRRGGKFR